GIHSMTGSSLYIPAMTVTADGSAFLVYNVSNASTFVSVAYAARQATDLANTLPYFGSIQAGLGPFTGSHGSTAQRWGDITSATLDPTDPTRVWISAEYAAANNQWATVIAELGF
ncbi:MAG TPA: hypothetical protein VGN32_19255, partial [Ktedonobacterales bacterium]|nr:hypothetical protein [Ktedonobacterales bacterium]